MRRPVSLGWALRERLAQGKRYCSRLAHVKGDFSQTLNENNIFQQLEQQLHSSESKEGALFAAFMEQGLEISWGRLLQDANGLAAGLISMGYEPGDKVGIWLLNYYEWILMQFACHKIGVIVVNVNPAYQTEELAYALNFVGCKGLLMTNQYGKAAYRSILSRINLPEEVPSLQHVFTVGEGAGAGSAVIDGPIEVAFQEASLSESNMAADVRERMAQHYRSISPHDLANIQYTSGSTGHPKPAALSHHNILNNGFFVGDRMKYQEGKDTMCIPVPLYHCFGTVLGTMAAITHGVPMVFPAVAFDEKKVVQAVQRYGCTSLYGVPTMFIKILTELDSLESSDGLQTLRTGVMAGSQCPPKVMADVVKRLNMSEVTIVYGMTETSPASFQSPIDCNQELKCETVGVVHPHTEVKIIDDDGNTLERGQPGELCTKGYSVMTGGYYGMEAASHESIDSDGFMHSGDVAELDDNGYCRIVGRKKDMIIRGGENIYPAEIEAFLHKHPKILDVAVIGLPHPVMGEEVCACVILKESSSGLTLDELKSFSQGKISHFKIPSCLHILDHFPLTATGKIQKFMLQKQLS